MKKIIGLLAVALLLFVSVPSRAQVNFGVKGGVNITSVNFSKSVFNDDNVTGFYLGPTIEAMVPYVGLGADFSILYARKGTKVTTKSGTESQSIHSSYIDVPLNLKWKLGVPMAKLFLAAGPYISFRVSNDNVWNFSSDVVDQLKEKSFGAGLNIGGGVEVASHLQVSVTYTVGLTNNYKVDKPSNTSYDDLSSKPHGWSIGLAYLF